MLAPTVSSSSTSEALTYPPSPVAMYARFMEGTSSYGFQRHKSAGTEAKAMEHRVSFRDRICFLDMVGLDIDLFCGYGRF